MRLAVVILSCLALLAAPDAGLAAKKKKKKPRPAVTKEVQIKRKQISKPIPIPKPKPSPVQPQKPEPPPPATASPARKPSPEEREAGTSDQSAACRSDLLAMGVAFSIPQSVEVKGACTLENPVAIASLSSPSGRIDLPSRPMFNCRFARQFAEWAGDVVAPVVSAHLGSNLAALSTGPGYECRGRNGDASGKISQHGHGNAVDIDTVFLADKRRIAIGHEKPGPESRALKAIRMSGCSYFTTVLGPGSNEAHATHFHFDMAVRGKSNNYRICE